MKVCVKCKKRPVHIKKRGLCSHCYQRFRDEHGPILKGNPNAVFNTHTSKEHQHGREVEFIRNYFTHDNWIYQPATFRFDGRGRVIGVLSGVTTRDREKP